MAPRVLLRGLPFVTLMRLLPVFILMRRKRKIFESGRIAGRENPGFMSLKVLAGCRKSGF
jgi:hypothetical protein